MSDPTTQSNYLKIASENISFDWKLDFEKQTISGTVTHTLRANEDGVQDVIFDTFDLEIEVIQIAGTIVPHELKPKDNVMGSALCIPLPKKLNLGETIVITVRYRTSPESTALQWLDKEQTQGKKHPYLFSQCQPIYARSLAPLQDTPSIKTTYTAQVVSVLPVLLSAIRRSPPSDGPSHGGRTIGKDPVTYTYEQPIPIPSYLIAIAAGNVVYKPFPAVEGKQWTSGVWAEPELIQSAYAEFSEDTTRFLAEEEKIVTPYRFGVYDLLVLPPSFPYGGMENACLSFLTPTLLTGDRALVDVVVHELTHSWFGNGITHANASHFWLNEGWTTYMERVLQQFLHSPAHRAFSYLIGSKELYDALTESVNRPKYQRLVIDFEKGEDPDDAYSSVPYEKGANFLLYLEQQLGGLDVFLPYVKDYVTTFMGKSIVTDQWKSHLYKYFREHGDDDKIKVLDSVDWNAWLHGEGLELPVKLEYDTSLAEKAYALADRWDTSRTIHDVSQLDFKESDLEDLDTNQIIAFLGRLQTFPALPGSHLEYLAKVYHFSMTPNAEIRLRFYSLVLKDPKAPATQTFAIEAAKWVTGEDRSGVIKGRMKFCRPVLRAVGKVDINLARSMFEKKKNAFHPIARKLIEKVLFLQLRIDSY
ncbi:peptidase family M1-domain-containing protein [Amanita rubescens]|nr:peptidase family M1-domain-containing protein [Amanita rubescens]